MDDLGLPLFQETPVHGLRIVLMWGVKTTPKVTALKNAGDISLISGLRLSCPTGSGCNEINQQDEMNHGHQKRNQGLQKHPILNGCITIQPKETWYEYMNLRFGHWFQGEGD